MEVFLWIILIVISYFLGNVNGAILISKYIMHDDVRSHGSGNAGLTNYFRTYGGIQSLLVIVIDVLKCVMACVIAAWLLPDQALHAKLAAGLSCIIGHSYPVFAGFRGGKGILCGAALGMVADFRIFLVIFPLFVIVVALTRFVSLGSVLAAMAFAVSALVFFWGDWLACGLALVAAAFVIWRHRSNIVRLMKGTESKLTFHKK